MSKVVGATQVPLASAPLHGLDADWDLWAEANNLRRGEVAPRTPVTSPHPPRPDAPAHETTAAAHESPSHAPPHSHYPYHLPPHGHTPLFPRSPGGAARPRHAGEGLRLLMKSVDDMDDTPIKSGQGACGMVGSTLTLHAIEAEDDQGERHALGNLICGALSPFLVNGVAVLPPMTLTLMRRGSMTGGVIRDSTRSASLVLFASSTS